MRTFHDFIATKTCPSCEFLVVFGQLRLQDRKSAVRVGMVCGAGAGKIYQIPAGAGRVYILRVRGGSGQKCSTRAGLLCVTSCTVRM